MIDVCNVPLKAGAHAKPEDGFCIMEAASYVAREKFSDHPECVSPIIAHFLRSWNDSLSDEDRNRLLRPYIFRVVGTKGTKKDEEKRAWLIVDWLARVQTPAWLRLAGLTKEAQAIEACARIADAKTAKAAQPALDDGRQKAAAAGDAAGAAAWAAAGDAAWAAAGDAAGDAARAAARAAAGDAARAAARAAAWAAAWAAARAAAWAAARAAAGDAARAALRPTVVALQESALRLLDELIAVGKKAT